MVDDKDNKDKQEELAEQKAEEPIVREGIAAYNLDGEREGGFLTGRGKRGRNLKVVPHSSEQAATSEGGDNMSEHYLEKYLDQRIASLDEKFSGIQRTLEQSLAEMREDTKQYRIERQKEEERRRIEWKEREEQRQNEMRERDNQRHAEILAQQARTEAMFNQAMAAIRAESAQRHADFASFQAKIEARFKEIDERFDKIDARFEKMDERFDKIDARFEKMDERFEKVDGRFGKVDEKLDSNNKWNNNLAITVILAIAALVFANIWALVTFSK